MKNRADSGFRKLFRFRTSTWRMARRPVVALLVSAALTGCTRKSADEGAVSLAGAAPARLNLAIWGNYFEPSEEKRFEELTGIDVQITNYSSNEELLAKIQAGAGGIDMAIPSDYMVDILIKQDLLFPLEKSQIRHLADIDPQYLKLPFDPENRFSLPYAWTTAGIAVHRELYKGEVDSWKKLLETAELKGRVSLLDDTRETFAVALKVQGFSVNEKDEAKIRQAKDYLSKVRPQVKSFRSDVVDLILRKEVAAAHAYGTEALQAWKKSGGKIEYVLPDEGGTFSIDNMVILKSAENVKEAHALINFFLTPETNVKFVERILAGPVLKQTRDLLPADLKNHRGLFPPPELLKKFERLEDIGEATRTYDRAWTELKSQ